MEDDKKENEQINEETIKEEVEKLEKLKLEVDESEKKEINVDYKDIAIRALADLENYKKRIHEENKSFKEFACYNVITDFIPIYNNLKQAISYIPENQRDIAWVKGVVMIGNQFNEMLKNYNIEEFSALNQKFDHNTMDAVMTEKDEEKDEDLVLKEVAPGYKLNGKVVMHAKVVVNKK